MVLCFGRKPERQLTEQERADQRHKRGWFAYAFATEAFVIVAQTLFMPVALEQYARENGRATPDLLLPCPESTDDSTDDGCKVNIGGRWTETTSFSLYVSAASMGLQLLTVISISVLADHPYYRKPIMLRLGWIGSVAAIIFIAIPSSSKVWPLVMPLTIIANVGYGASYVALNAYLPGIAARDPAVLALAEAEKKASSASIDAKTTDKADSPIEPHLVPADGHAITIPPAALDEEKALDAAIEKETGLKAPPSEDYQRMFSLVVARTSLHGTAVGYTAGIILLVICLIPVILLDGTLLSLRIAICMSGVWWAAFIFVPLFWLRTGERGARPNILREMGRSWAQLFEMITPREFRKMTNTFKYLAAWFLLCDGLATITATAILFARTKLHMSSTSLIILAAIVPLSGIVGNIIFPIVQRKTGWTTRTMILLICALASLLPLYGSIGIPLARRGIKGGGLTIPAEMYAGGVYFGLLYGAFHSFARALYAEIIPLHEEARWYALYSITDKASSFVGPLIIGGIADATGDIRWGFVFLVGQIVIALPVLLTCDVRKGREAARLYRRGE